MELTKEVKKILKRLAAARLIYTPEEPLPGVLIHRSEGDYDWEDHTFLVDAANDRQALKKLERRYPVYGLNPAPSMYDCTGRPFCDPAKAKRVAPDRYIVTLKIRYDL